MEISEEFAFKENQYLNNSKTHNNNYEEEYRVTIKNTKENAKKICVTRPRTSKPVTNTICLAIEDLRHITHEHGSWKIFNVHFNKILVYGSLVLLNHFENTERIFYVFTIDDGTDEIPAILRVTMQERRTGNELIVIFCD
jgi:hypothetical protein